MLIRTVARATVCMVIAPGLISSACAAATLSMRASDFEQFWQRALAERVALPPSALDATRPGYITFQVTETASAQAYYYPGSNNPSATPVIHIYEEHARTVRRAPADSRACLYLCWRDGSGPLSQWYLDGLPDRDACSLRRAILTGCQAVDFVRTHPALRAVRVGLVGDGFGGVIALAVAALMPERVAFVIAHQPRPAFHRLSDGEVTSCPVVRSLVRNIKSDRETRDGILSALTYFDAVNFALMVEAPTLLTAGAADRQAPLREVRRLYHCLGCKRDLVVFERLPHCSSASLPAFPSLLQRWIALAEGGTRRLTSQ